MKTKSIKQTVTFDATPEKIYHLIMDQKKHAAFTGSKVTMSTKVNGKFSVFDGYCHGYNIELIEGKKIVQAWHFAEEGWPDDHYSICTFLLEPVGNKTKLIFLQTGVPEQSVEALKEGWKQYYWEAMKTYLGVRG
jgi:activator of HSP90 ATPase